MSICNSVEHHNVESNVLAVFVHRYLSLTRVICICTNPFLAAGLSFQNIEQRERVVILIDDCYRTIGWPRRSLSEDLRVEWAKLDAV